MNNKKIIQALQNKKIVKKLRDVEEADAPRFSDGLKIFYGSVSVYDEDGELLAIFIKNILPEKIRLIGRKLIAFKGTSDARGAYAGTKKPKIISKGKHKGEVDIKGKTAHSTLVGYLLPYLVKNPQPQISSRSKQDLVLYGNELQTLYKYIDELTKKVAPEIYKENALNVENVPSKFRIGKINTNVQVNVNQIAHYHVDTGNANKYGTLLTFYPSGVRFKGGEFVVGDYRIAFDLKEGDYLLVNQKEKHGTLPFKGDRLSAVGFQSNKLINYFNKQAGEGQKKFPKIVYSIPSYDRIKTLTKQTLPFLERYNIDKDDIYIFVANEEQYNIYEPVLRPMGYNNIIIGILGLKKVIRFIQNYFPNGQRIVHINDDVRGLKECKDGKMVPISSLKSVINRGFTLLDKHNLQLFGFYPLVNEKFQCHQEAVSIKLKFIVGAMYAYINDKSLISKSDVVLKEDYERSITSYLKYGSVIRFNHIGIITTYANTSGGVSALRKKGGLEKKESFYLKKEYPNLVHFLNRKRVKEGFKFDIFLKDKSQK